MGKALRGQTFDITEGLSLSTAMALQIDPTVLSLAILKHPGGEGWSRTWSGSSTDQNLLSARVSRQGTDIPTAGKCHQITNSENNWELTDFHRSCTDARELTLWVRTGQASSSQPQEDTQK